MPLSRIQQGGDFSPLIVNNAVIANTLAASGVQVNGSLSVSGTLTVSGTINGTYNANYLSLTGALETVYINNSGISGTANIIVNSGSTWLYTIPASGVFTVNLTTSGTINALLSVGQSITASVLATQGATAYTLVTGYGVGASPLYVDGYVIPSGSLFWQGGAAPTAGNVTGIDAYTFTVIKTSATPTYTVLASQTKF